jgi:hypothetical protein
MEQTLSALSCLLCPLEGEGGSVQRQLAEDRIQQFRHEVREHEYQLARPAREAAGQVAAALEEALTQFGQEVPKTSQLEESLRGYAAAGLRSGAVVLATEEEARRTQEILQSRLATEPGLNLQFRSLGSLTDEDNPDFLVFCGWLGERRMFPALHSHLARASTVLAYGHEQAWHDSAARRSRADRPARQKGVKRTQLLALPPSRWELDVASREARLPAASTPLGDFELRLDESRTRQRRLSAQTNSGWGEGFGPARLVEFSDGSWAWMSEGHRVLVVTEIPAEGDGEAAEVPVRAVGELRPGDLIALPEGTDTDAIRRTADAGLRRAGKATLRQEAARWKEVLRAYSRQRGIETVIREMRQAGCRRRPSTIRTWISGADTIGPQTDGDLEVIARVTQNADFRASLGRVRSAISTVRSAHLQAGSLLARELRRVLPRHLPRLLAETCVVDVEGTGQFRLLRVENVDADFTQVRNSLINKRLNEE